MTPREFREARQKLGLDREEMAARLGVSRQTVWRIEEGHSKRGVPEPIRKLVSRFLHEQATPK